MKKLMTFAFAALLIGGFAFTANAQPGAKKTTATGTTEVKADKPQTNEAEAAPNAAIDKPADNQAKPAAQPAVGTKKATTPANPNSGKKVAPQPNGNNTKKTTATAKPTTPTRAATTATPASSGNVKTTAPASNNVKTVTPTTGKDNNATPQQPLGKKNGKPSPVATQSKAKAISNAQAGVQTTTTPKGKEPKPELQAAGLDINKCLKDFEANVEECLSLYKKIEKDGSKSLAKDFEKSLSNAQDLKAQLEGVKEKMDRSQIDRFNKACNQLNEVLIKK